LNVNVTDILRDSDSKTISLVIPYYDNIVYSDLYNNISPELC